MANATEQMKNAMDNIACQVPLQCIDKCKYKKYPKLPRKVYEIDEDNHLKDLDPDWSNFLQAQADSSAKYLYSMNFYGHAHDPTMVRKDAYPVELIQQRLIHMPIVGPLSHEDMFYMLSFILNLTMLSPNSQMEIMTYLHQLNLLDTETLTYIQIICRHPNTGLTEEQKVHFQYMTQELINRCALSECGPDNYFNPQHLFQKASFQIDPYELAHLQHIMEIKKKLTKPQYLYLARFVELLEEMPAERRDQYLYLFYNMKIIPMCQFSTLLSYLHHKSLPYNTERLKLLFKALEKLLNIEESLEKTQTVDIAAPKQTQKSHQMEFNALKLRNGLMELMKGGTPNIIRLTDLRIFIRDILLLRPKDLEILFNTLKQSINSKQWIFFKKYIEEGKISGPALRLKLITTTIDKILNESRPSQPQTQSQQQPQQQQQQQQKSQQHQGATSNSSTNVKSERPDNTNKSNVKADSNTKKGANKHNAPQTAKVDVKSLLKDLPNDHNNNNRISGVGDIPNNIDERTIVAVDYEEREVGGLERQRKYQRRGSVKAKRKVSVLEIPAHKLDDIRSRSSHDDNWSNASKTAFKYKMKNVRLSDEPEQRVYKTPKIDYFIYPPPRRHGPVSEYLIDTPRGPIPLISNRALWFHFPMRDSKMNKIVSIKDGVLNLK